MYRKLYNQVQQSIKEHSNQLFLNIITAQHHASMCIRKEFTVFACKQRPCWQIYFENRLRRLWHLYILVPMTAGLKPIGRT